MLLLLRRIYLWLTRGECRDAGGALVAYVCALYEGRPAMPGMLIGVDSNDLCLPRMAIELLFRLLLLQLLATLEILVILATAET